MNRIRKLLAFLMVSAMILSVCSCARVANPEIKDEEERNYIKQENPYGVDPVVVTPDPVATPVPTAGTYDGIVDMTMYIAMTGREKNDGNDIQEIIAEKSQFLLSLCDQLLSGQFNRKHQSIVDRCTKELYFEAFKSRRVPLMSDFYHILKRQV